MVVNTSKPFLNALMRKFPIYLCPVKRWCVTLFPFLKRLLFYIYPSIFQVRKFTHQARRNLLSRKVISDEFVADDLPGGVWKTSATMDVSLHSHDS